MKYSYTPETKGLYIIIGFIVYMACMIGMHMDISGSAISVIKDISESKEGVPVVVYSQRNIDEIRSNCKCWIACTCFVNKTIALTKGIPLVDKQINILAISPTDIRTIIQHKIIHTPVVIMKSDKKGLMSILGNPLHENIGMFTYTVDGLIEWFLHKAQIFSHKEYKWLVVSGILGIGSIYSAIKLLGLFSIWRQQYQKINELFSTEHIKVE